ncbi:MAG: hypothetical protein ONB05_06415 [candidate division KSB1 bacterium]|nr:hypothetical protein [candidate division KSB1 bacterium]
MSTKSFIYYLDPELEDRIREEMVIEKGIVTKFLIQYEAFINGKWYAIVRYDTAHNFAHRDIMKPNGTQIKYDVQTQDFNQALTIGEADLKSNWKKYRSKYESEL